MQPGFTTSSETRLELTVLMPCLNEAETLATCIRKARACIDRLGLAAEVLVADNGSTDGSQRIAEEEGARVVAVPIRGYGAALYHGSLNARGRYIIMGDSDDSYDFSRLDAFVEKLRGGADLVMGNRFLGGVRPGAMPWKNKYIGNPVLSAIGRLFFDSPAGDFHCGLRGFSRAAFDRMELQTTGMEFASEMVIKATLLNLRIVEVPTTLDKDGRNRPPHLRPWRDGWRHLRFMLLYSPRWLFLYPGAALMLVGGVVGVMLLPGPFRLTESVVLDVHTLLFAFAAILLGFQGVTFAICARVYALIEGLLPEDRTLERMFGWLSLETGLLLGAVLLLLGLVGGIYAVAGWSKTGFGPLDARATLRTAIPSAAAICLGGQVVFTSFLLSFLGLRRRSAPFAAPKAS
jgi:glycosyltransferase involved in cell wall biosynthesis